MLKLYMNIIILKYERRKIYFILFKSFQDILQKSQDTSIKRQTELREKIKFDRQVKEQLEKEIKLRDNHIEQLTQQIRSLNNKDPIPSVQEEEEEVQNLREKVRSHVSTENLC